VAALAVGILLNAAAFIYTRAKDTNNGSGGSEQAAVVAEQTATRSVELTAIAAHTPIATPVPTQTPPPPATATSVPDHTATAAAAPEAVAETPAAASNRRTPTPRARTSAKIADMLPADGDVPQGFVLDDEGKYTVAEVAASFPDTADAQQRLEGWKWREGRFRAYKLPESAQTPDATNYLYVSIHQFGTADAASSALEYFADARAQAVQLRDIEATRLGDEMRAMSGRPTTANEVDLYIRQGSRLIRVAAFSQNGDPLASAEDLAKTILGK
jgi:hypothetical protein